MAKDEQDPDHAEPVVDTSRTVSPEPPHSAYFPQEEEDLKAEETDTAIPQAEED